jgi:hypothetical protein
MLYNLNVEVIIMSTESVGNDRSATVAKAPVTTQPFDVPQSQEPTTPPQPESASGGAPKSSFQGLEQWNKSPLRAKADAAIKKALAGGQDLSPQDKEAIRRNVMVLTEGKDFDEATVTQAVSSLVKGLRDPNSAETVRGDLWTQQAQAFGGLYVPDQYKQTVAARLRGGTGAPANDGPGTTAEVPTSEVPTEQGEIDPNGDVVVPTGDEDAPVATTEAEEVETTRATAPRSSVQALLAEEFAKLARGKPTIPLTAMAPILKKLGIGADALPQIEKILEQRKIDPKAMNEDQYARTRLDVTTAAAMRLAQQADPKADQAKLEQMVKDRLPEAIQKTTI